MSTDAYDEVVAKIRGLTVHEQQLLVDEVKRLLGSNGDIRRSVLELQGLGKEIWRGIDAQEYVRQERASWTG